MAMRSAKFLLVANNRSNVFLSGTAFWQKLCVGKVTPCGFLVRVNKPWPNHTVLVYCTHKRFPDPSVSK